MVTPYSADYNTVLDQAQEAQNNKDRPELSTHVEDMNQYDPPRLPQLVGLHPHASRVLFGGIRFFR